MIQLSCLSFKELLRNLSVKGPMKILLPPAPISSCLHSALEWSQYSKTEVHHLKRSQGINFYIFSIGIDFPLDIFLRSF